MDKILPFLLTLICPIMMIFMMKGMHGGGHKHNKSDVSREEMDYLIEQNNQLTEELKNLKSQFDKR